MGEEKSPAVENWLGRLGETTAKNYLYWWGPWAEWLRENGGEYADKTPEELVEIQKHLGKGDEYKILDVVQRYILSLEDKRANTKRNYYRMVRSFFMHNRAELPRDKGFNIRGDLENVESKLTIENVRDLALRSNKCYRAVFLCMFMGGMGRAEFEHWNLNGAAELEKQLRERAEIVKISLPGRKKHRFEKPFHTYIGGDALEALKDYLATREETGDAIFYNQIGEPVKSKTLWHYWRRNLGAMGLIKGKKGRGTGNRYGYHIHELRDLFRSQWEKSPAKGSVAEYMMGHVVDANEYNKAAEDEKWARDEYYKALPFLNLISDHEMPYGLLSNGDSRRKMRQQDKQLNEMYDELHVMMQRITEVERENQAIRLVYHEMPEDKRRDVMKRVEEALKE